MEAFNIETLLNSGTSIYLLLLGLAVLDSINPSALVATGFLLTKAPEDRKAKSVLMYVAGIFVFYFLAGVLLLLGLSFVLDVIHFATQGVGTALESTAGYVFRAIVGTALIVWAWLPKNPAKKSRWQPKAFNPLALFIMGITITLIEFATALPYFGATALLQQADILFVAKLGLLLLYNIIFILPPLGLLLLYKFNKARFEQWLANSQKKREQNDTIQWLATIGGAVLILQALSEFGIL